MYNTNIIRQLIRFHMFYYPLIITVFINMIFVNMFIEAQSFEISDNVYPILNLFHFYYIV